MNLSFGFYNGDLRSVYMANCLSSKGLTVNTYNTDTDKLNDCRITKKPEELFRISNIIITPVSLFINNDKSVDEFCRLVSSRNVVFGGCFPEKLITYFKQNNIKFYDYMNNEDFVWYNTIATAEGVLAIAISETDINLCECNTLILGNGRCAKTLIKKLQGLCLNVTVSARKESVIKELCQQEISCFNLSELHNHINKYHIIINTVPAMILDSNILCKLNSNALIIDIASKPGGVDFKYCDNCNIKAIHALSLPGKYAPKATAMFLCRLLLQICQISY